MRLRPPPVPILLLAAGACLSTTGAQAQSPQPAQATPPAARYLTWANRPVDTTPADVAAARADAAAAQAEVDAAQARVRDSMIPRRVAPSQSPYRPMLQPAAVSRPDPRGLTPATAWLGPPIAPTYAPGSPDPIAYAADATAPVAVSAYPSPVAPQPRPQPLPQPQPQPQPVAHAAADPMAPRPNAPAFNLPHAAAAQPATTEPAAPADPMAPRRDARIFQIQQDPPQGHDQAALTAPAPAPRPAGQSGVRYYSVHRDAGQRPDPTPLPEPVYFDSVAIDLAEPPAHEVPIRDAQGRRRAAIAAAPSVP